MGIREPPLVLLFLRVESYSLGRPGDVDAQAPGKDPLAAHARPTAEAPANRVQGSVELELVVRQNGEPDAIRVVRSLDPGGLDLEAVRAVRQWRFRPGHIIGMPVDVLVTVLVSFSVRRFRRHTMAGFSRSCPGPASGRALQRGRPEPTDQDLSMGSSTHPGSGDTCRTVWTYPRWWCSTRYHAQSRSGDSGLGRS